MKKVFHFILVALILVSGTGLVGTLHYCGQQLVAIDLFNTFEDNCCGEEPADCCEDDVIEIERVITDGQIPAYLTIQTPWILNPVSFPEILLETQPFQPINPTDSNSKLAEFRQHLRTEFLCSYLI